AGTRPLMPAGPIERALIPASRPGSRAARADEASRTRARARARRTGPRMRSPVEMAGQGKAAAGTRKEPGMIRGGQTKVLGGRALFPLPIPEKVLVRQRLLFLPPGL